MGNLLGGGVLYWELWRMYKGRFWGRASLSIRAPLGNLEGASYTGDFDKDELRRTLGVGHLYRRELCDGNMEGGLLSWRPRRIC